MPILTDTHKQLIRAASADSYTQGVEACGLIAGGEVIVCENSAAAEGEDPSMTFVIDAKDMARDNIQAVWHSHNNGTNRFSGADIAACKKLGIPFILHDYINDRWLETNPSIDAPMLGASFVYGTEDCYTLVRRYYWQILGIELKDYDRGELFDDSGNYIFKDPNWNKFRENFAAEGFEELSLREILTNGDVLLMQIGDVPNPTHIGVVVDAENEIFYHHPLNGISRKEDWCGYWRDNTVAILRRKDA